MKKAILSSLCSGLIIPGFGQILNHQIKKGVLLLSAVFLLFVGGCIKLALVVKSVMANTSSLNRDPRAFMEIIRAEHLWSLWILVAFFGLIWAYAVIDAFFSGRKAEKRKAG